MSAKDRAAQQREQVLNQEAREREEELLAQLEQLEARNLYVETMMSHSDDTGKRKRPASASSTTTTASKKKKSNYPQVTTKTTWSTAKKNPAKTTLLMRANEFDSDKLEMMRLWANTIH